MTQMKKCFWVTGFLFISFIGLSTSCKKKSASDHQPTVAATAFTKPSIPHSITTKEEAAQFLAIHYWENFNFNDTLQNKNPDITEQAIVDFIGVLHNVPLEIRQDAMDRALQSAASNPNMFRYFWTTLKRYLDDPNSPIRDEDLYITVCQSIGKLENIDIVIKSNAAFYLQQAIKNRVGSQAADFRFTDEKGRKRKLSSVSANYTLIFFYDPECDNCTKMKQDMREMDFLNALIDDSKISILAFSPQDNVQEWKQHLSECSPKWINGYDPNGDFSSKQLYDIKAFPTLYLLDKNKKVVLKDVTLDAVLSYLDKNA